MSECSNLDCILGNFSTKDPSATFLRNLVDLLPAEERLFTGMLQISWKHSDS